MATPKQADVPRVELVRSGDAATVTIPADILAAAGLSGSVEVRAEGGRVVLGPGTNPRAGWEEAFRDMRAAGDDTLLDPETPTGFDDAEWVW